VDIAQRQIAAKLAEILMNKILVHPIDHSMGNGPCPPQSCDGPIRFAGAPVLLDARLRACAILWEGIKQRLAGGTIEGLG